MDYLTDVLNDLGLRAHLKVMHDVERYFGALLLAPAGTPDHPQVFMSGWI
jgi:hypothetical protein